jgi:hypothetical protein
MPGMAAGTHCRMTASVCCAFSDGSALGPVQSAPAGSAAMEQVERQGRLAEKEAWGGTKQDGRARRAEACTRVWLQAHTSHCGKASKHVGLTHQG